MRKILPLSLAVLMGMGVLSLWLKQPSITLQAMLPSPTESSEQIIRYEKRNLSQSVAHILFIPSGGRFLLTPILLPQLAKVDQVARTHPAIAIFNAGFFDPANRKTISYIYLQGKLSANPKQNYRLVNNPNLKPYISKILNRSEFRRYKCGSSDRYDITFHNSPTPKGCKLIDSLGAGPQLLPKLTLESEGFVDKAKGRDSLGSKQPNARTAIGIKSDRSIVLVMVAQKPEHPTNSGVSLQALADFMKTLGVEKAMNLDGGSSSSFYYNGKTFYGKVDERGNYVKRSVKSVLLVQE